MRPLWGCGQRACVVHKSIAGLAERSDRPQFKTNPTFLLAAGRQQAHLAAAQRPAICLSLTGHQSCRAIGILQADAYAGFNGLYHEGRKPGPISNAGCWAHGRRYLFELAHLARAPLAAEAVRRIDAIFDVERTLTGLPAEQRLAIRQTQVAPLVRELETWMRGARAKMSRHSEG